MSVALAPGKAVLSGAYTVLRGEPALVTAVGRYVRADAGRSADFVTPEVRAAIGDGAAPWFDASALRDGDTKLGLGSSAAILVASLAARELSAHGVLPDAELARRCFTPALTAHRAAQGGGSGIDVAASAFGGTLLVQLIDGELSVLPAALPPRVQLELWFAGRPASTAELLGKVRALATRDAPAHDALLAAQATAARRAVRAVAGKNGVEFIAALADQTRCLAALGEAARAPIVTVDVAELLARAGQEGAAVMPSGAGGGDVVLYAGTQAPSAALSAHRAALGLRDLQLELGARGVHAARRAEPGSP